MGKGFPGCSVSMEGVAEWRRRLLHSHYQGQYWLYTVVGVSQEKKRVPETQKGAIGWLFTTEYGMVILCKKEKDVPRNCRSKGLIYNVETLFLHHKFDYGYYNY